MADVDELILTQDGTNPHAWTVEAAPEHPHGPAVATIELRPVGWRIGFRFDPRDRRPTHRATLPAATDAGTVCGYAVELAAAADLDPGYAGLLATAMAAHPALVDVVRAHAPYRDPVHGMVCRGDEPDEPTDGDAVSWPCRTAVVLATSLRVGLILRRAAA